VAFATEAHPRGGSRRPRRRLARLGAGLAVVVVVGVLGAGAASAQAPLGPEAPAPADPEGPGAPGGGQKPLLETVVPGSDPGQYPTSHYDLGYDDGGVLGISNKVLGLFCAMAWATTRWLVRAGIWIVEWSFSFGFAERLAAPVENVAGAYQTHVVDRLGLAPFFMVLAAGWCAFQVFRGRLGRGAGEFFVSVLIAALAATVLASPSSVLFGGLDRVAQASVEVAAITTSADGAASGGGDVDAEGAMRPLTSNLHRALIERPHELLNWGRFIPPGDPCRALYEELVATGPHETDGEPRERMGSECSSGGEEMEKFNGEPTAERLGATLLVGFAALVVVLLMVIIAASLIAAQLGIVFLVAVAPFPIVGGILPGGGRGVFWRWLGAAAKGLATVLMTTVFLALFLVSIDAVLIATAGEALMVQMALIDLLVVCAFVARKRLVSAGQRMVTNTTRRLEGARVGGTGRASWLGPAAAGGAAGFAASQLWDDNKAEMGSVPSKVRHQAQRLRSHHDSRRYRQGANALAGVAASTRGGEPGPDRRSPAGGPASGGRAARAGERLAQSRTGRAAKAAGKTTRVALQSTLGAPVYVPRATRAARAATRTYASSVRSRVDARLGEAKSFAREYQTNSRKFVSDDPRRRVRQVVEAGRRVTGARR
jgi:hypothetical protein